MQPLLALLLNRQESHQWLLGKSRKPEFRRQEISDFVTQVRLPAATRDNIGEVCADVKERDLFADAGHLEDGGCMSQSSSPLLSRGRGFYKEGEGNRIRIKGGGCKVLYVQMSTVYSDKANDVHHPGLVILDSRHPVLLHPDSVVEGQQISRSWDA